ncbi:ribbon-helix-helix domain-containing protein [Acetobacter suratthaniensis]|uniref:Ribbon-helix-helix protein, CopG family n=1 Tax=Acetobacter suratthaniensis TaxID=1502841 RepID=A0ABS3LQ78_9PROT|nr:CopG family transcriptional regulator [Acetobacter suratthaniensis]MBO1329521.1 ribbon-helix-helix protein, CopG family [Acetobacter suratthaniensis]MCX2567579.1 ribbon-helix-helix domain-containing protein [Acetobacter suratthaniensis]
MSEVLVMRSVYLPAALDAELRQIAHDKGVSKSDLIRTAVALKAKEWRGDNTEKKLDNDVQAGLRASGRQTTVKTVKPVAVSRKPRAKGAGHVDCFPKTRGRKPATAPG